MIAKTREQSRRMKILAGLAVLLGLCWLGFLIWLAFRNWQAAMFICALQIALNTGGTKNQVTQLAKKPRFF